MTNPVNPTVPGPAPIPVPAPITWQTIAGPIIGTLQANLMGYLKDHPDSQALLVKWGEQIAKLMVQRVFSNPVDHAADDELITIYKKAMKEELDALVIDAEGLVHSSLSDVLNTIWNVLLVIGPALLKFIPI